MYSLFRCQTPSRCQTPFILLALLILPYASFSQHKLRIEITDTSNHKGDTLFLAGSFNSWNPHVNTFRIVPNQNGVYLYETRTNAGMYEYKVTRGSWSKVEVTKSGKPVQNRFFRLSRDTLIKINIEGWADDFPSEPVIRRSTASKQVSIIDTAFYIPQLNRYRRIWIYLPGSYQSSGKKYPVIYMHDGQNVFDAATSGFGEWGVDEHLDSSSHKKEYIVVGVDHGGVKRMNEYNPYDSKRFGNGEGDEYVDFLVNTLKPFIDKRYRTLSNKKNTAVAGSSMGGIISFYAVLKYPKVFGAAGIFSPAFWTAVEGFEKDIRLKAKKTRTKLFFYMGGMEGDAMIPDMKKVIQQVKGLSKSTIMEVVDQDERHNEGAWRKYFPRFVEFVGL